MGTNGASGREVRMLRERLTRLSEASVWTDNSLGLEALLQEVLESARALTDSRYGVVVLLDDSGNADTFLGSGMTWNRSDSCYRCRMGDLSSSILDGFNNVEVRRPAQPHTVARATRIPYPHSGLCDVFASGIAYPVQGRTGCEHLSRKKRRRSDVPEGRRGDPDDVRFAGSACHRERPQVQGRTASQVRSGDPDQHFTGRRRRYRCKDG